MHCRKSDFNNSVDALNSMSFKCIVNTISLLQKSAELLKSEARELIGQEYSVEVGILFLDISDM